MTFEQATHLAQTWGLLLATALFLCAVLYALWPANKSRFDRAARAALDQEDTDGRS